MFAPVAGPMEYRRRLPCGKPMAFGATAASNTFVLPARKGLDRLAGGTWLQVDRSLALESLFNHIESKMTTAKKPTAFNRALTPSAELAAVIGATPQPRTEVVKLMWEYIKANNLQNPKNKRNILADAKLKAVFGKDEVTMFEMTGLVGKHLS